MTEEILTKVCAEYGISRADIGTKVDGRQVQNLVEAKQTGAYLLWRYTNLTGQQIANNLGYRTRNNVNNARKKVKEVMKGNHAFAEQIKRLVEAILRD